MADYASPAPSDGGNTEPKKITFRFCADCSNLLYPRENPEDRNSLQFACRTCNYYTDADTSCIYRNEMSNTAAETAGVTSDLGQDPTVSNAAVHTGAPPHHHSGNMNPYMDVEDMDMNVMDDVPSFCTMCGQEIFCEICGQETKDAGLFIEADDEDPHHALHANRPKEIPLGPADEYDFDEDNDADMMDHDHHVNGQSHMTERNGTQQEQES
ncbi:putative dna directed rna polymerase ii 15 kda protein [Lasiodiplodia theobromae]|uniref:DNA-directed RNA polymerase II subunit RPB9 n=2 Tax=Lasiodiplodia TaxID=66739 RepID=A0A5N5DHI7_9PEZI|nr:DNA directed RNA polymerase ii [Lasiodiplodia theobromae]KAB2577328.1 DNA-directed RNA polymerase II subunit RPB9 [Lasiodiplodia theobromae]KAF4538747.1 DNA directed RNA polymerase ii [Lasiodiplodia theobromae]KAF9637564.1 putative dna directed rna polymerase ii 15 kda protein [Lasiodiplodia theobromae]